MNDQEKSVLLARAMGWWFDYGFADEGKLPMVYSPDFGLICVGQNTFRENYMPDLYLPENMALAWRVAEWAWENLPTDEVGHRTKKYNVYVETSLRSMFRAFWLRTIKPDLGNTAQRLWLDKILELAIEAGLVEADDAKETD